MRDVEVERRCPGGRVHVDGLGLAVARDRGRGPGEGEELGDGVVLEQVRGKGHLSVAHKEILEHTFPLILV